MQTGEHGCKYPGPKGPRPTYGVWEDCKLKIHVDYKNNHLKIRLDDIGPDGKNEIFGLPIKIKFMNNEYYCTFRQLSGVGQDAIYKYVPDVCDENSKSCQNGAPFAEAEKYCTDAHPLKYETVTYPLLDYSSERKKSGEQKYSCLNDCKGNPKCDGNCGYHDVYYTAYFQLPITYVTEKIPTDVCSYVEIEKELVVNRDRWGNETKDILKTSYIDCSNAVSFYTNQN